MAVSLMQKMRKEAEVEYRLLLSCLGARKFPDPDFLEIFSYKCDNMWFRSKEFRLLLIDYRLRAYPKKLRNYLDELRKERKRARIKAEKERVKRKYVRKGSQPTVNKTPEPKKEPNKIQPVETIINFTVKIQENLD